MDTLIDLARCPVHQPASDAYAALLGQVRGDLAHDGCAVLKGFVHADGLDRLAAEADSVADQGHWSQSRTNAYFSRDDISLPADHPVRQFYERSNAFIPADNFAPDAPLRSIYEYAHFMPFICAALGEPEDRFFRYDDPLADVIINMVADGSGFPWHFDTNNYTVTLAIQNAQAGGEFEYAPGIRAASAENFERVAAVLNGSRDGVTRLVLDPGDLQIFRGRYSLHRVCEVKGARRRYVGIFSFAEKPGMCGGVERTKQLYGRVLPHHHEHEGRRGDQLLD